MSSQRAELAQALEDAGVLDELHAFLWTDPFFNQGTMDAGWSCRDHAVVVGQFLVDAGAHVTVRHGKCMFVQGPTQDGAPPVGLGQDVDPRAGGHTWLSIEGLGDVDLSPRLNIRESRWRPVESTGVVGSSWLAEAPSRFTVTGSLQEYDEEIARATHVLDERHAIYFSRREEPFANEIARSGLSWADSRVSLRLLDRGQPDDLYVRFARHLRGILSDERSPLRHLSRNKAWTILAEDPGLVP